jgi:hypothetical protein
MFPVVGLDQRFHDTVPRIISGINALRWDGEDPGGRAAAEVLRSLGLTESQRRVFLSYRRAEALRISEQLWDVLSRRGFQVFLDRFSVDPGVDFQAKLFDALEDKSFLLVLESPGIRQSSWVENELNYARKRSMGLAIVTWPGLTKRQQIPGVYPKYRFHLVPSAVAARARGNSRLSSRSVARIADMVERRHAEAFLRRRLELIGSVSGALRKGGIRFVRVADWSGICRRRSRGRLRTYIISVTPRPPDVPDLFALHALCSGSARGRVKGILIHAGSVPVERGPLLGWTMERRGLGVVPEAEIITLPVRLR